jgi:phenylpyruvate tautomerase
VICINDKADLIFAGTDAPAALGTLCSLGSINKETNGKITAAVTDLLEEFGLDETRIYINFYDIDPANMGWSRKTFAG